jgi:hypothetical protein
MSDWNESPKSRPSTMLPIELCDHNFAYGGVKYRDIQQLPGTGAKRRLYFDWFYCTKCLCNTFVKINYEASSFQPLLFNATPAALEDEK